MLYPHKTAVATLSAALQAASSHPSVLAICRLSCSWGWWHAVTMQCCVVTGGQHTAQPPASELCNVYTTGVSGRATISLRLFTENPGFRGFLSKFLSCVTNCPYVLLQNVFMVIQGHQRILWNSRSLDIDHFERKYAFWAIVPHLHIQHFILEVSHLT